MQFLYVPDEAIFHVDDNAEDRFLNFGESPVLDSELSFTFPDTTHPLNVTLSNFFQNGAGFFHYDASILYEKNPFQLITSDRFPSLHNLVLRVEAFERFDELKIAQVESENKEFLEL